ncbi:hypothetical protein N9L47_07590 [Rhodobacteraceae bacterium]|nr:hypothetical protein [Paracoccaceae bacterium]
MINAALLALTLGTTLGQPGDITCTFAAKDGSRAVLDVALRPTPSLRDLPGLYRLNMRVGTRDAMPATAQPNLGTKARDIALTAKSADNLIYALGFGQDGQAALNIRLGGTGIDETLFGICQGATPYIDKWLAE